jgi:hypothetical protein
MEDVDLSDLGTDVIRDRFGYVERGVLAAHIVGADATFRGHARSGPPFLYDAGVAVDRNAECARLFAMK